jgi:hypothetical protein
MNIFLDEYDVEIEYNPKWEQWRDALIDFHVGAMNMYKNEAESLICNLEYIGILDDYFDLIFKKEKKFFADYFYEKALTKYDKLMAECE